MKFYREPKIILLGQAIKGGHNIEKENEKIKWHRQYKREKENEVRTKNYVLMCRKAKEIQKLRKYNEGGWFYTKHGYHRISDDFIYFITDDQVTDNWITRINGIWLPMQEQLQEMLFTKSDFYDNLIEFTNFVDNEYCYFAEKNDNYKTFNELWLAFVMYEKYNKTWTGKDWISIGTTNKTNQKV